MLADCDASSWAPAKGSHVHALEPISARSPSLLRLIAYGVLAAPLAFALLPIYVHLPAWYAMQTGLSLAVLGTILLATRFIDAALDPPLGLWIDHLRENGGQGRIRWSLRGLSLLGLLPMAGGFIMLFSPPQGANASTAGWWLVAALLITYLAFSVTNIAYQAWGAVLAHDPPGRARVTAVREAIALVGVVLAAILPTIMPLTTLSWVVSAVMLICGAVAWMSGSSAKRTQSPHDAAPPPQPTHKRASVFAMGSWLRPFANPQFRPLFAVFVINGIATAIPATLVMFFIQDRLQASGSAGLFLGLYFLAGVAGMPLWLALAKRIGQRQAWTAAMLLAIAAFAWTALLGRGDILQFALLCAISGLALGAELALPPALLATVIAKAGQTGQHEGAYFGLWTAANKLNLALAAGLVLPLLAWAGYQPQTSSSTGEGLLALTLAYTLLPCALKLIAAVLLWRSIPKDRHET